MHVNLRKEIRRYLRPVKNLMRCPGKHKKLLYASTEQAAKEYIEMNPDASMDQLFEYLGTPTELVENYMSRFEI